MRDIIIIGSGPAGLTAAVYARRAGKTVLVIEKETFGGQITYSPKVENFPGFPETSGSGIADKLLEQAMGFGAEIELDTVTAVEKTAEGFKVIGEGAEYTCRALIIASGSRHRQLGLEGENELVGNGISYCAVCDGAFHAGAEVTVIGGGNTALQDAVLLSEICPKVTVVQNLGFLTGEACLAEKLAAKENVSFIYNTVVKRLLGEGEFTGLELYNTETGETFVHNTRGVFVAIGQQPENEAFANLVDLDERGYIVAGESCETSAPGVFAAGDCRTKTVRQAATACGDGAVAALAACRFADCIS
ncbi:MAG: FAD-dependent oxidoreductase [Clostridia bacterium]|nr:FAD-dependent oxidoreductase [Clostridia bacterium]